MIHIEEIYLTRGSSVQWLEALPEPWLSFRPATTLGELACLAPSAWRIYTRHCLKDTVVYGNRRRSFGITLRDGRWRFRFCDAVDNKCLDRKIIEDALRTVEGSVEREIEQLFRVLEWEVADVAVRLIDESDPCAKRLRRLQAFLAES
jgi:hypothetical protein